MKFLLLDSLVIGITVIIRELFWLGKAGFAWVIFGLVLAIGLTALCLLSHREEIKNG